MNETEKIGMNTMEAVDRFVKDLAKIRQKEHTYEPALNEKPIQFHEYPFREEPFGINSAKAAFIFKTEQEIQRSRQIISELITTIGKVMKYEESLNTNKQAYIPFH